MKTLSDRKRTTLTHGPQTLKRSTDTGQPSWGHRTSTKSTACKGENGDLQSASLCWIEVNDVTWKLTDGTMERTPACHGKWGGFNTERGLAWCMETGWVWGKTAWFARYRDRSYGPTDLKTAKKAAMAFATGAASFPDKDLATTFDGPVNLNADHMLVAERRAAANAALQPQETRT
jgi:hypothetical protein